MAKLLGIARCAVAAGLVACTWDSSGPKDPDVVGVYSLQTVNSTALPVVVAQDATSRREIVADVISINPDRTFTETTNFRVTAGTTVTETTIRGGGSYTTLNGAVSFTYTSGGAGPVGGSVQGKTLTILNLGSAYVFQR